MTPVESYLADLFAVRGAGTAETSGYPALVNLLNEVGGALKPKITAVIHPSNSGAGLPDGGFFSAQELRKHPGEVSHFFRSTLIQTLFYGIFSAWVLWNEGHPKTFSDFCAELDRTRVAA